MTFEVRRLVADTDRKDPAPVAVDGTRDATGVAWESASALLVTRAPSATAEAAMGAQEADDVADGEIDGVAGLYRVQLKKGTVERLWAPKPGDGMPTAPLALQGGRVALAINATAVDMVSRVVIWERGKIVAEVEVPFPVHALVAAGERGRRILALTLGIGESRPAFVEVDVSQKTARLLGYHHALYHAARRAPGKQVAVVAREDSTGRLGWSLTLVDADGRKVRDLGARAEHDLLPAGRPGGGEIAFLAEVAR